MARRRSRRHNPRVDLPVNVVDLAVVGIVILAAVFGWRSGALPQVLGLAGAAAGVAVVILVVPAAAGILDHFEPPVRAFFAFGGAFLIVGIAEAVGSTLGASMRDRLGGGVANRLDAGLGSLFGIAQAFVLAWLVGGLLATGPVPSRARAAQRSLAVRPLLGVFPPPSDVAGQLGSLIDSSGLPQVFSGLEPQPAPPVPVAGGAEAARIAAAADASVVLVESQGCAQIFSGTGFAVAPNLIVTNAHVVAGATDVAVTSDATGRRVRGTVVFFDPELDVALIRTPDLVLRPLVFAATAPVRGTVGAALGPGSDPGRRLGGDSRRRPRPVRDPHGGPRHPGASRGHPARGQRRTVRPRGWGRGRRRLRRFADGRGGGLRARPACRGQPRPPAARSNGSRGHRRLPSLSDLHCPSTPHRSSSPIASREDPR